MSKFAGMVSETSVTFTGITGENHVISTGHPNNERIRKLMRETQAAFRAQDYSLGAKLWQELTDLADVPAYINKATCGRVTVKDSEVYFDGDPLHNAITTRILWTIDQGYDPEPYMKFLDNLMENPSKSAVDELFGFMEACNMGITDDGHLVAYKRVRPNYNDIFSNTISNKIGQKPSMRRNSVDENKNKTCSAGLHFCSFTYLPHFSSGGEGEHVMILKINPRDVVAIPTDYNNAKGRACLYEVIGEVENISDILSTKPIWDATDLRDNFGEDDTEDDLSSHRIDRDRMDQIFMSFDADDLHDIIDGVIEDAFIEAIYQSFGVRLDDSFWADAYSWWDAGMVAEYIEENCSEAPDVPIIDHSSTLVIHVYPVSDGNITRWEASCPEKNWKQSYARKRDVRRGVERVFANTQIIFA